MRKIVFLLLLGFSFVIIAHSQTSSVKGTVTDTVEGKNLVNTVISLLHKNDSTLIKFIRADINGNFIIEGLKADSFVLLVTHPYMGDYFDNIATQSNKVTNLENVFLTPKTKLLQEVIVRTGAPIRVKGDTTVYTADSFRVRPGANVEELLRRLPGIQVDKDGQITAMGERVKKVLVDGEEFFGSDPGIATKNLRADAVKEVQVFDKKSDQAEFTGIDDGVRDKTINLKMKEMTGYFGKVEAAGGIKDKFSNDAMINAFKGKRKLAAYGIMSNTGQTNLDWRDAQNYGGGSDNVQVMDDGGIAIFGGGDDYYDRSNGIPTNWNGGLHYSNKFNGDKLSLNSSYKFSKINAEGTNSTFSKTFLPDTSWSTSTKNNNFSSTNKHSFNVIIESTIDSMNSLKWTTQFNNNTGRTSSNYYSETLNDSSQFINNSTRNSNNNSSKNNVTSTLLWKHKFKKISRTLSVNSNFNWYQTKNTGLLYSLNNYYLGGILNERDTTDQKNIQDNEAKSISTKIAYTEPLTKDAYLEINYTLSYNNNNNDRITNIKSINGKYEAQVDSLSNSFVFNRLVNTPGINFRLNKKKYNFSFGSSVGFNHYVQNNITTSNRYNYNFTNFYPQANVQIKMKSNQNIRLYYNGSSNAPSLEQLQPTVVNTDPLNIYIGNQDLKQSFRHTVNLNYSFNNVLKQKWFYTSLYGNLTQNAFVQSNTVDNFGRRTYQTVNANGVYNFNFYSGYNFTITKSRINLSFGPSAGVSRNIDFINGVRDVAKTNNYGIRVNLNKYVSNKYNFNIGPTFSRNHSVASVNTSANADYWSINSWVSGSVNLPHNFEINTNMNVQLRQKDPRFSKNSNYTNWNASFTKRMLKDNAMEIKLSLYDILDQNQGYNRSFNSYSFTESYYTTLRRFWLLTLTWNISKNGKPASF